MIRQSRAITDCLGANAGRMGAASRYLGTAMGTHNSIADLHRAVSIPLGEEVIPAGAGSIPLGEVVR
jgi:hypothetical protein